MHLVYVAAECVWQLVGWPDVRRKRWGSRFLGVGGGKKVWIYSGESVGQGRSGSPLPTPHYDFLGPDAGELWPAEAEEEQLKIEMMGQK